MKNVLALCGSARRGGNTDVLVEELFAGAREIGATTKKLFLSDLDLRACTGCLHCKENEDCSVADDMKSVLDEIRRSHAVVIGSPVYMGQVTGQTKVFLDRLYQLRRSDRSMKLDGSHIKGAVIVTCGAPSQEHPEATANTLRILFRFLNQPKVHTIVGTSLGPKGAARERSGLLDEAREVGRRLVE